MGRNRLAGIGALPAVTIKSYNVSMRKGRREHVWRSPTWEIRRLKATPAAFIGLVDAPDETSAVRAAIKQFAIPPRHQKSLIAV